jgi:hypothetical protein
MSPISIAVTRTLWPGGTARGSLTLTANRVTLRVTLSVALRVTLSVNRVTL